MIVIPHSFNYRLIIGTLVIAIAVLGSYSISSYISFQEQEEFLSQETILVQNELSEMISLYDDVSVENESIKLQLEQSKAKVISILDSVKKVKANLSLISSYRNQIYNLKKEREVIFDQIDSLVRNNEILQVKVDSVSREFESQKLQLASLSEENSSLNKIISEIGALKVDNISVASLKTTNSLNVFETDLVDEVDQIEVCTSLTSNEFTPKGNKNIFVQILDPEGDVISERGIVKFDKTTLPYSGKTTIRNVSGRINACLKIGLAEKGKMKAGIYSINLFQDTMFIGNATIDLK